jgi:hypothetical protein
MATTQTTATHTITYVTHSNGAPAKGRRCSCSGGALGVRFAFYPTDRTSKAKAQTKAEKDAAAHLAGEW